MTKEQHTKLKQLDRLIYEPEHEKGVTCWCQPVTTVYPKRKKAVIKHKAQRDTILDFVEANFL